jgi:hypothetical protein
MAPKVKKARKKNPVAQALVALRNKKLTPAQRSDIARKAAQARWEEKAKNSEGTKT